MINAKGAVLTATFRKMFFRSAGLPAILSIFWATLHSIFPANVWLFLFILAACLCVVFWVLYLLALAIRAAWEKQWAPASVFLLYIVALPIILLLGFGSGDYLHVFILYPHYKKVIAEYSNGQTSPVRFDWGDAAQTVLDGTQPRTLIYDAGETTLKMAGKTTKEDYLTCTANHLIGHFYKEECISN